MRTPTLRLMKDRRYEFVPIDQIEVLNSRRRDQEQFAENVRSIRDVGLLKPVMLNERYKKDTGKYQLICGEGRLIAHKRLEKKEIAAEIISCDRKDAYLISLVENIARVPPGTMWFAKEVQRMRDAGMPVAEICRIIGKAETHVAGYLALADKGEERLIKGVEQGVVPIRLAMEIAMTSTSSQVQNLLVDAFDEGLVTQANLRTVRRIISSRFKSFPTNLNAGHQDQKYSVAQLRHDIAKVSREKNAFVREAGIKEGRVISLIDGLKTIYADKKCAELLRAEKLDEMPELQSMKPASV